MMQIILDMTFNHFKMKALFFILFTLAALSTFSQEYMHDANGNMSHDANKEVEHIHYNVLNLPDTLIYADGRTIIYAYTALGEKVSQQVVSANGTLLQKRDYVNDFQYRNDTLRELQHSEGRVVPILPGNTTSSWEYQYHLTDHLGNVRTTLTSKNDTSEYMASMETESAAREQIIFDGLEKNRVNFVTANHTARGNEVAQVRSDEKTAAISMDLAVQRGDIVYLQVHAYYEGDGSRTTKSAGSSLSTVLLPIVLGAFNGAPIVAESQRAMLSTSNITGGVTVSSNDKIVPKAHLNYQLFDNEYKAVDAGFVAVTEQASFKGELLTLGPLKIQRSGYLYVYLSNSSEENIPVYFDDLKITHVPTPVIQEDSYDPFGMTLSEQHVERFGKEHNNYLFNGKELQDDFALNWYDYGARMYDAALGRWHVTDLLAEKYSSLTPYNYAMNNPVKLIDPDGRDVVFYQIRSDKARFDKLMTAVTRLKTTDEGRKILSKAHNNKNITVYVAGTNLDDSGVYGMATVKYAKEFFKGKGKKVIGLQDFKIFEFRKFLELDITADVDNNKDVYFVLVDVDNLRITGTAFVVGHELEAHVNINQKIKGSIHRNKKGDLIINGTKPEILAGDSEHHLFGNEFVNPNGPIISHKVSSADRLHKQLWASEVKRQLTPTIIRGH
jgi:RHS repeat-associated protein